MFLIGRNFREGRRKKKTFVAFLLFFSFSCPSFVPAGLTGVRAGTKEGQKKEQNRTKA
jgi:hypothetical protein